MTPLRVYHVAGVGYVLGRIAGRKIVYRPEDVFTTRAEADKALDQRTKKVDNQ